MSPVPHTTADIAGEMGLSERSTQRRLRIARNLDPDPKVRLAGSEVANSTGQLLELARIDPGDEPLAADLELRREADNVRHAAVLLSLAPDARRWLAGTKLRENVTELAKLAKLEPFTPDDLRRTFAREFLDAGADLVTAQKLIQRRIDYTAQRDCICIWPWLGVDTWVLH